MFIRWMFDCCRIPGQQGLDWSVTSAKEGDDGSSGHVIVFRKGRAWKLDTWKDRRLLSLTELEQCVIDIFYEPILSHIEQTTQVYL